MLFLCHYIRIQVEASNKYNYYNNIKKKNTYYLYKTKEKKSIVGDFVLNKEDKRWKTVMYCIITKKETYKAKKKKTKLKQQKYKWKKMKHFPDKC